MVKRSISCSGMRASPLTPQGGSGWSTRRLRVVGLTSRARLYSGDAATLRVEDYALPRRESSSSALRASTAAGEDLVRSRVKKLTYGGRTFILIGEKIT